MEYLVVGSFSLYAGRLDDRPPLLDLGFLARTECLRCLLGERRHILAEIGEPFAHGRIGERIDCGRIELRNDIVRRASAPSPYHTNHRTRLALQQHRGDMLDGANAGDPLRRLVGIGLEPAISALKSLVGMPCRTVISSRPSASSARGLGSV
jgi:hypothetical protein